MALHRRPRRHTSRPRHTFGHTLGPQPRTPALALRQGTAVQRKPWTPAGAGPRPGRGGARSAKRLAKEVVLPFPRGHRRMRVRGVPSAKRAGRQRLRASRWALRGGSRLSSSCFCRDPDSVPEPIPASGLLPLGARAQGLRPLPERSRVVRRAARSAWEAAFPFPSRS